jgi:hypothetical protein
MGQLIPESAKCPLQAQKLLDIEAYWPVQDVRKHFTN